MAHHIIGLFPDQLAAEAAVEDLKNAGFDLARMGVVMRDVRESHAFAADHGTQTMEGAVAGSLIGGSLGALLAATGALVIPGIGPFISGGILATTLVGGAVGWLAGGLAGLGIPRDEAEYYEQQVEQGRVLLTVESDGRDAEARTIMTNNGAVSVRTDDSDAGNGSSGPNSKAEGFFSPAAPAEGRLPALEGSNFGEMVGSADRLDAVTATT